MDKSQLARELGVSRASLYYQPKQPAKDWSLKIKIEQVLREEHSYYGHKRMADHLGINKKRTRRVMKLYGIKPYRRRTKKPKKNKALTEKAEYPNLLLSAYPQYSHHIWASDFTYIPFQGKFVYLATVIDLFSREVVGFSVMTRHNTQLIINTLLSAINNHPVPVILHSDQGREYTSKQYITLLKNLGLNISMSHKGCPWENGYQESFYSQFKLELGDTNRFDNLGELVYEIYQQIYRYNHTRIHSALKMPPLIFSQRHQNQRSKLLESVS